jgi:hypothetical protein
MALQCIYSRPMAWHNNFKPSQELLDCYIVVLDSASVSLSIVRNSVYIASAWIGQRGGSLWLSNHCTRRASIAFNPTKGPLSKNLQLPVVAHLSHVLHMSTPNLLLSLSQVPQSQHFNSNTQMQGNGLCGALPDKAFLGASLFSPVAEHEHVQNQMYLWLCFLPCSSVHNDSMLL